MASTTIYEGPGPHLHGSVISSGQNRSHCEQQTSNLCKGRYALVDVETSEGLSQRMLSILFFSFFFLHWSEIGFISISLTACSIIYFKLKATFLSVSFHSTARTDAMSIIRIMIIIIFDCVCAREKGTHFSPSETLCYFRDATKQYIFRWFVPFYLRLSTQMTPCPFNRFSMVSFFLSFVCGAGGNGPPDDNSQWSVDRRETSRAHIYYENVINAKDRRYKSYKIWFMIMFTCDPYRRATQTMLVLGIRVCFLFFSSHTM